jgi:hypothetical protein
MSIILVYIQALLNVWTRDSVNVPPTASHYFDRRD